MSRELLKTYFRYVFAFILSALSSMLGNVLDGVIVGQMIGPDAVAAVGMSRPLLQAYFTLNLMIGSGGGMLVGIAIGKGLRDEANSVFRMSVAVLGVAAAVATALGLFAPGLVTRAFCTESALLPLAEPYFLWMLVGAASYFGMFLLETFVAVDGEPGIVTAAVVVDNAVNVGLSVAFIKFFGLGIAGAAIGTVIGHVVAALLLLFLHWFRKNDAPRLGFSTLQPCNFSTLRRIASQGTPLAISSICLTVLLYAANVIIAGALGKDGMFIYAVAFNLLLVFNLFLAGASQTLQSLGAIEKGKGGSGFGQVVRMTYLLMIVASLAVCAYVWIWPESVVVLFGGGDRAELVASANSALRVFAPSFMLFCLIAVHLVVCKLEGKDGLALFISFAMSLTVIPILWAFAHYVPAYIWWSYLVAYMLEIAVIVVWEAVRRLRTQRRTPTIQ